MRIHAHARKWEVQLDREQELRTKKVSGLSLKTTNYERLGYVSNAVGIKICFKRDGQVVLRWSKIIFIKFQVERTDGFIQTRFGTWRQLWLTLAIAEKQLGLPIPDGAIEEMQQHLVRFLARS